MGLIAGVLFIICVVAGFVYRLALADRLRERGKAGIWAWLFPDLASFYVVMTKPKEAVRRYRAPVEKCKVCEGSIGRGVPVCRHCGHRRPANPVF